MNVLICPYTRGFEWCEEIFPGKSLCSLPVAGKMLTEHLLDFCSLLKAAKVRIVDYGIDVELGRRLLDCKMRWPLKVEYAGTSLCNDAMTLLERNSSLKEKDAVLIFWGALLPYLSSPEAVLRNMEDATGSKEDGIYFYDHGNLRHYTGEVRKISCLREYFDLNFALLQDPRCYIMRGYSAENGVYAGMDVVLKQNCQIEPPVMLGDHICVERECALADGVIIGDGSLIDAGTILRRSIVFDHTFVGGNMEVKNKIITGARIIDVASGVYVEQKDIGISSGMKSILKFDFYCILEYLLLIFFAAVGAVPYLLFHILGRRGRKSSLYWKLSLDRYPKIWRALLHGGRMIRRSPEEKCYVLCVSEGYGINPAPEQLVIDDLYYQHYISVRLILEIVVRCFLHRSRPHDQQ